MSKLQKTDCQEIFTMIDKKGTGKIPAKEVGNFMRGAGLNPLECDVKKAIEESGGDKAEITLEQAYAQYSSYFGKETKFTRQHFIEMFKIYDRDGNETIYSSDITTLLSTLGDKLSAQEITSTLGGLESAQGVVNIGDYVDSVLNC